MNPLHELVERILSGDRPSFEDCERVLTPILPMMESLVDTPQDPEWHAEGDVRTHTRMVLEALYGDEDAMKLEAADRLALVLAALLHDIAKPVTTRRAEVRGRQRVVAPGHAARGRDYLAGHLMAEGLPPLVLANILHLVGHHHDPKSLVIRDEPAAAYRRLARQADARLLYHLALADMRGRICADQADQIELIELFRLGAEEAGAFGRDPYAGWRAELAAGLPPGVEVDTALRLASWEHEHGLVQDRFGALARCHRLTASCPRLTILCGPSASGKSTFSRARGDDVATVSMDALRATIGGKRGDQSKNGRVAQAAREALKVELRVKGAVVWDATCLRRDRRAKLVDLAIRYDAHVTIAAFLAPPQTLYGRNAVRAHPVPREVLDRQIDRFQVPDLAEAHQVVWYDADGQVFESS